MPVAERTVFELKPLSAEQVMAALDVEGSHGYGSGSMTRIMAGLVGWTNLRDADGNEIKFEVNQDNVVKMELLDKITAAPGGARALLELSMAVRDHSEWSEAEVKNSDSPHSSSPEN